MRVRTTRPARPPRIGGGARDARDRDRRSDRGTCGMPADRRTAGSFYEVCRDTLGSNPAAPTGLFVSQTPALPPARTGVAVPTPASERGRGHPDADAGTPMPVPPAWPDSPPVA